MHLIVLSSTRLLDCKLFSLSGVAIEMNEVIAGQLMSHGIGVVLTRTPSLYDNINEDEDCGLLGIRSQGLDLQKAFIEASKMDQLQCMSLKRYIAPTDLPLYY